ncbi:hypothetical protein D039_0592B, partial [Vibrio parahaemolyticus EKP-028]
ANESGDTAQANRFFQYPVWLVAAFPKIDHITKHDVRA